MPQQSTDSQTRPPTGGSGPFRLSLQLPEKKRQQLQAHEQGKRGSHPGIPGGGLGSGATGSSSGNGGSSGGSSSGGNSGPMPMTPNPGNPGGGGGAGGNFYNSPSSSNNNNQGPNQNGMNPNVTASYIQQQAPGDYGGSPVPTQYPFTIGMHVPGYTQADQQAVQQARTTSMGNATTMNMMQQQAGQMAVPLPSGAVGGGGNPGGSNLNNNNPHSAVPMNLGLSAGPTDGMSPGGSIGSYNDQAASGMGQGQGGQGVTTGQGGGPAGGSNLIPGVPDQETFEFMKRKRWPQLLMQELVGAAVWCLIPYEPSPQTGPGRGRSGWKVIFASPATQELLGYKPEEIEGQDWADFVYSVDLARLMQNIRTSIAASTEAPSGSPLQQRHYQLSSSRTSAYDPPTVSTGVPMGNFAGPSKSLSVYTRMVCKDGKETLFELRGHPYFGDEYDEPGTPDSSGSNGGFDGGGVMGTTRAQRRTFQAGINGEMGMDDDDERSCKAFWVMGRKWQGQGDGGAKMLDSFLELKMENERLRQELRDLQARPFIPRPSISQYSSVPQSSASNKVDPMNPSYNVESSDEDEDDDDDDDRAMQIMRNSSTSGPVGMSNIQFQNSDQFQMGAGGSLDDKKQKKSKMSKNPEYLCRNCGRNDSPEWRKGPLGPKTLCNACGLRWAKRNAGNIPRRKPKDKEKDDEKGGMPALDGSEGLYDSGLMDMS